MRCGRCGTENKEGNRFCGMCGATLLSAAPVSPQTPQRPTATQPPPLPARPQTAETPPPAADSSPSISGPSFLGLNDPGPRKRASLSVDSHSSGSRNLDYLLDDEDHPRHGGAGKMLLILIALFLAVGLGYMRWKNQGLGWLMPTHQAAKPSATAPDDGSNPPSITPDTSAPATASSNPASSPNPPASSSAPAADGNTAGNSSPVATPPNSSTPADSSNASPAPANSGASPATPDKSAPAPDKTSAAADKGADDADTPAQPASKPAPQPPAPKPHAASKPAAPADPVAEARRYIYGKGSSQNCDRGLSLLKPAANAANPKAMIEMGALYSAGLCTPRDLPTAYRWFAMALRKDPSNDAVQTDLQKLWGEMTQPERQLAIKLTQ